MTTDKDFKRRVRARMEKTGESYTAARAALLKKSARRPQTPAQMKPPPDHAELAGTSDRVVAARTGRSWAEWVELLDAGNAHSWSHGDIARHIHDEHDVPGWWAQTVAVGYERIKGLREIGQRRDGGYEAGRSRTVAVPVSRLFEAFTDARLREAWLGDVELTVRTARPDRSVRITWDDGTLVTVWLTAKGAAKAAVQVTHAGLSTRDDVALRKTYWGERLDALAKILTEG